MAVVTVTIANAQLSRVLDAVAANTGYTSPEVNGVTKAQWVNAQLQAWIVDHVASKEARDAYSAAAAAANAQLTITVS